VIGRAGTEVPAKDPYATFAAAEIAAELGHTIRSRPDHRFDAAQ
jgi:hypothetical protein